MTRPKLVVVNTDPDEQPRSWQDGRKYRFDLSRNKLVLYYIELVSWPFVLCLPWEFLSAGEWPWSARMILP